MDKISALVTTYNHQNYIEECIASLVNQTLRIDEIYVVDNASSDNTQSIIRKMQSKYKNITLFDNHENLGPAGSFNFGIKNSEFAYLIFSSGDDYSELTRVQSQIDYLENNEDLSVLASPAKTFIDKNYSSIIPKDNLFHESIITKSDIFKKLYWEFNFIHASSLCFTNRQNRLNYLMNDSLIQLQDFALWLKLSKNFVLGYGPEIFVSNYLIHEDSISRQENNNYSSQKQIDLELTAIYSNVIENLTLTEFNFFFKDFFSIFTQSNPTDETLDLFKIMILLSHPSSVIRNLGRLNLMKSSFQGEPKAMFNRLFGHPLELFWKLSTME
jgi:glycosyltransferase involved in cell wall biosynthesis